MYCVVVVVLLCFPLLGFTCPGDYGCCSKSTVDREDRMHSLLVVGEGPDAARMTSKYNECHINLCYVLCCSCSYMSMHVPMFIRAAP